MLQDVLVPVERKDDVAIAVMLERWKVKIVVAVKGTNMAVNAVNQLIEVSSSLTKKI